MTFSDLSSVIGEIVAVQAEPYRQTAASAVPGPTASPVCEEAWRYGFPWGPMTITRLAHIPGRGYALEIKTLHQSMQVYVSEKGRKIEAMPVHDVERDA